MKTCIAILAIGEASQTMWNGTFAPSVRAYADRHGYEVVVFTKPLDESSKRSAAWQKLLIASAPEVQGFDQILFLDHDVMLSERAPAVEVPLDKIGAVTWQGSYQNDPIAFEAFHASWENSNASWVREADLQCFADLQKLAGYPPLEDHLNSGVLVFAPSHAEFFRNIYKTEHAGPHTSAEQAALTHWLCGKRKDLLHPMDRRWNVIHYIHRIMHYPFLDRFFEESPIAQACVEVILKNNFALHFCSGDRELARAYSIREATRMQMAEV